jgi:hypothetical protein
MMRQVRPSQAVGSGGSILRSGCTGGAILADQKAHLPTMQLRVPIYRGSNKFRMSQGPEESKVGRFSLKLKMFPSPCLSITLHLGSYRIGVPCLLGAEPCLPTFRMSIWGPSEPLPGIELPLFQPPFLTLDWPNRFWERGVGSRHVETAAFLSARFPLPSPPPSLPHTIPRSLHCPAQGPC